MSAFGDVRGSDPLGIWGGVTGWEVTGERATLALIELDAGSVVPEHAHDNEQIGILLRGGLRFRIGDETRDLVPGETWAIQPDVPHEVVVGPEGAALVEVFVPARDDWATLERIAGRRPKLP